MLTKKKNLSSKNKYKIKPVIGQNSRIMCMLYLLVLYEWDGFHWFKFLSFLKRRKRNKKKVGSYTLVYRCHNLSWEAELYTTWNNFFFFFRFL